MPHGLVENVAGRERVAGRGPPIRKQNRAVGAAEEAVAEHVRGFGRPHAEDGDRTAPAVAHLQRDLERVQIVGVEDGRQGGPIDGPVGLHRLAGDVGCVGDLLYANNAIVRHVRCPSQRKMELESIRS